jgi:hypothetical protein
MAGPSTSRALTEVEQMTVLNEVLYDETLSNYSSDDDSASDYDFILYTVVRQFSRRPNDSRKDISWSVFPHRKEGKTSQKMCGVSKKGPEVRISVSVCECDGALCLEGCFKVYHTLTNF